MTGSLLHSIFILITMITLNFNRLKTSPEYTTAPTARVHSKCVL